jgi:hypothetical protein
MGTSQKYEICTGGRLGHLEQLSCWQHCLDRNRIWMKIQIHIWVWIWVEFKWNLENLIWFDFRIMTMIMMQMKDLKSRKVTIWVLANYVIWLLTNYVIWVITNYVIWVFTNYVIWAVEKWCIISNIEALVSYGIEVLANYVIEVLTIMLYEQYQNNALFLALKY